MGKTVKELRYFGDDGCPLYAVSLERPSRIKKPNLVMLHGGGPDHKSLVPLANQLLDDCRVILPDLRGYGSSICTDASCYTWKQYVADLICLLDHIGTGSAIVGGAGIGTTISLKASLQFPARVSGLILISIEDIEDDTTKKQEIQLLEKFAADVQSLGIEAAWNPILTKLSPVISDMVRDAIPRSDAASIAAAAAIVYDRAFNDVQELIGISVPVLIVPGDDFRHPAALSQTIAEILPKARMSKESLSNKVQTATDFADLLATPISDFVNSINK